ncbi:endonuclease/exonuclease/phosphatase family protein [Rhizobium sp. KVB221]|uniref:Endonuclease/exonuclease/phosphatase family protein n=1 Tax=Rhizobium setariae TaxID=2801340 RepID=A0A936YVV5_9HYPH|nr:endonuclease/exonuclease/phosphatase family protein [Rhizobium setariae]MBL0374911.1 endonuclease/exonuclease/phosphatase family protein [Rhizobium setariae]
MTFIIVEALFLCGLAVTLSLGRDVWLLDVATFFWLFAILLAALLLVVSLFIPGWAGKILAAVTLAVSLVPVIALPAAPDAVSERKLRLITANLYVDNPDPREFVSFLVSQQPDIVVTQETRPRFEKAIREAGFLPFENSGDLVDTDDMKIFSRFPIRSEATVKEDIGAEPLYRHPLRVVIDTPNGPLVVYAVHPDTPRRPGRWRQRNLYLQTLADHVARESKAVPVVVAGDWNTPPWSAYFRGFFDKTGFLFLQGRSWPAVTRFSMRFEALMTAGVTIDHVALSPVVGMVQWRIGPKFGSNHLPVIIDIGWPQANAVAARPAPVRG